MLKEKELFEKHGRLLELTMDIIQHIVGAEMPDYNEKIQEFVQLHNEIRKEMGKKPRKYNIHNSIELNDREIWREEINRLEGELEEA